MTLTYVAAFAAALVSSLIATPVARRLALKLGVMDRPTDRKLHRDPVPYLGGVAIVIAFSMSVAAGVAVRGVQGSIPQIATLLGGALVLSLMGLWDDLTVVPGWVKVPVEILLAVLLFYSGSRAQLFDSLPLDLLLTVAWVVGITNAINYMDNMDGLTAGVVAIASTYFLVLAGLSQQSLVASLAAALAGCALGFLWHNRAPARIFMGDAGSLFLGFLLAGLGLELRFQNIISVTFFVPIVILALPILDALMVSASRVRRGLSPIAPGKDHISHRLVKIGVPPKAAVGILYFTAAGCGWLGVVIAFASQSTAYLLLAWVVAVGLFGGYLLMKIEP